MSKSNISGMVKSRLMDKVGAGQDVSIAGGSLQRGACGQRLRVWPRMAARSLAAGQRTRCGPMHLPVYYAAQAALLEGAR